MYKEIFTIGLHFLHCTVHNMRKGSVILTEFVILVLFFQIDAHASGVNCSSMLRSHTFCIGWYNVRLAKKLSPLEVILNNSVFFSKLSTLFLSTVNNNYNNKIQHISIQATLETQIK